MYIRGAGCWDVIVLVEMEGSWKVPQDTTWAVMQYLLTNDKVNREKNDLLSFKWDVLCQLVVPQLQVILWL